MGVSLAGSGEAPAEEEMWSVGLGVRNFCWCGAEMFSLIRFERRGDRLIVAEEVPLFCANPLCSESRNVERAVEIIRERAPPHLQRKLLERLASFYEFPQTAEIRALLGGV